MLRRALFALSIALMIGLSACASKPISGGMRTLAATPAMLFDAHPGPILASDLPPRPTWPASVAYWRSATTFQYSERFIDHQNSFGRFAQPDRLMRQARYLKSTSGQR